MIKRLSVCFVVLLFVIFCPLFAFADTDELYDEQRRMSGADDLLQVLPKDAQDLLEQFGSDPLSPETYTGLQFGRVLEWVGKSFEQAGGDPLRAFGTLAGIVLICGLFGGFEGTLGNNALQQTYRTVSVISAGSVLLLPLGGLLRQVQETAESVTVFISAYVPTYGALLIAGGSAAGAVSYQTTLLAVCGILSYGIRSLILPLLAVALAFGCAGAVADGFCLDALGDLIHKAVLWAIGLFSTVFTFVLSLQQMVAAAGDSFSARAVKFSLSSFIPVVGGAVSEAYSTVVGCAGLLRSTVGCFGLLAVTGLILPVLAGCIAWSLCLHLSAATAGLFQLGALEKLCRSAAGAVKVLIALLAVFALLMVVSTSVMAFVGKGVA